MTIEAPTTRASTAGPAPSGVAPAPARAPSQTNSAVYEGWVRHRRFEPIEHSFSYRFFLTYLDLAELPGVLDPYPLYSARRRAPARFRRADYMGDPRRPLDECARDTVSRAHSSRPPPAPAPPARSACSPACATSATPSTRSASTTASTPTEVGLRL